MKCEQLFKILKLIIYLDAFQMKNLTKHCLKNKIK